MNTRVYNSLKLRFLGVLYFAKDINLSHSVFALPFLLSSLNFIGHKLDFSTFFWIIVCMVFGRSFAMGMNRYLDRDIDALNPRTASRMIPSGFLSAHESLVYSALFGGLFVLSASQINFTTMILSPLVLVVFSLYPYMKRVSYLTHLYLGGCLGLSPIGASLALSQTVYASTLILGGAIAFWVAGFDIIYALQDRDFDVKKSLKSIPSYFGIKGALKISRVSYMISVLLFVLLGLYANCGIVYYLGVSIVFILLSYQHYLLRSYGEKNSKTLNIGKIFFDLNAMVSVVFLIFTQVDFWMYPKL